MLVTGDSAIVNAVTNIVTVRRIGDYEINAFMRKLLEDVECVAADDVIAGKGMLHAAGLDNDGLRQRPILKIQMFITYSIEGHLLVGKEVKVDR